MSNARKQTWLTYGLLAIGLALLPFLVDASLGRTWVRLLDFALLYVMLALGLNIVVGNAGLLDLGYVAFYALGAYVYAWLASPHFGVHLPFWAVLPMGAALAGIFGAMLGGLLLGLIESFGAGYIGDLTGGFLGSHYQDVFAFFVLILVLVFRPSGLLGEIGRAHV